MQHYSPETLVDYINGELEPEADAAVYMHVAECSQCHDEYEAERSIREALLAFGRQSEREMPESLVAAIWSAAHPPKPSPFAALGALLKPRLLVPALGGVFSIALGMVLFTGNLSSPSSVPAANHAQIEAATFLDRHSDASMAMPFADHVNAPTFESAADTSDDTAATGS